MIRVSRVVLSDCTKLTQFTGDAYLQSMMGHGLRANSQSELVDKLITRGFLHGVSACVEKAFRRTDSASFLPKSASDVYSNNPQKIFGSNHYMSTPQLHAQVLSLLGDRIGPGKVACEIGAGSGYLPTVFARAGCRQVYAIEKDSDLLSMCEEKLSFLSQVVVASELRQTAPIDALYIAPYMNGFDQLNELLERIDFSNDALVLVPVKDGEMGVIQDQQMMLLERKANIWTKTSLFRTLCEAALV